MPELPEVEVLRRDLEPEVVGTHIANVRVTRARSVRRYGDPDDFTTPLRGRAAASQAMDTYFKALPDFHFTLESAIASGNDVLVSWVATGTPQDEHSGASLTTRPLRVAGCTVSRLRHRKIVHTWNYWDTPICG